MPIYEYRCRGCGETFERIHAIGTSPDELNCPECGATSPEKRPSVFAASTSCGSAGSFG